MPLIATLVRHWFRHEVDGGWAWIVCAASFLIQFIVFGTIQSYGIIFIALLDEFKSGEYETAWIGSLAYGLQFFIGPITTTLCEHFGCRKMVFFGTGILMVGLFASSFSTNLSTLFFTFGILWGIGASFTFFPCILVLRFYFSERISLANGISMSGAGIGTIVINVVLNRVIQDYGWRGGLRMLGGLVTLMFACGGVYLPPPADFYAIREWSNYKTVKFTAKLSRILDVRPWKQKAFVVYVLGISLVLFGYFVPYVHLVRFGETLGVSSSQGALLVGYMSISQIFAKLCCGRLADMKTVRRLYILEISILGFAICNMAVTAAKDFDALLAYVVFFGFFDGLFVVVLPILICDIVGRDLMATAIGGFYGVVATPMMLGPPISGQLYDAFNSYAAAFLGAAVLMIIGGVLMYVVYRLKPELVRKEVQFSEELEAEDMFTSNLFSCPSIHSHTVDALSGMFMSERYSMVNLDRPSQITFNPLHNLSYTKSRAGSSVSRQTYFPSLATDDCSEGRSEIFLQRLRGSSTATDTVSRLQGNASVHDKDDGFATSTPKVLSIDDVFVKETPDATNESTSPRPDIGACDVWIKDEITGLEAATGEQAYVNEITALEDIASTETLVNLDCQSEPKYIEVLDTVPDKGVLAESEVAFLELNPLPNINASEDLKPSENQIQDQVDYASEEESVVGANQGVLKVEGFLPHDLPIIPEGIESTDPYHLQNEQAYNKESLLADLSASTETPSTDLQTKDVGDPTVRTATLVEISDSPLSDKLDDSDTLVPEDTDLSLDMVKCEETEPEFEQIVAEDLHEDDALVKLPPPPNVVRKTQEMVSSPLVDLQEDRESDNQDILVNILEDIGPEAENIQLSMYTESERNNINVSSYPAVREELLSSPVFIQGNTGDLTSIEIPGEAQDFHTPITTEGVNSTHFDLLSRRLEAVAAEQMKGEVITRFPTDEMTLFAASRSMVPTPFENQNTPVSHKEPCSSQQSKGTSAHRTPRDSVCTTATDNWQQPSHTEGQSGYGNEVADSCDSHSPADYQENKGLSGNSQENEIIKIPPPPDFERRRPPVHETQEPIIQFQDLESELVEICSEMDDSPKTSEQDACKTFIQDPGSVEPLFRSSAVEKEEEDMTISDVTSLVPRDVSSPVRVETLYDDQAVSGNEIVQEIASTVSNSDVDSVSERLEDIGNRQLQDELTTKFLTDKMTLFPESRNLSPDDTSSPMQQVNTASTITNEISIFSSMNPSEMASQDDVQFPGSPPSNNASEMISGISENVPLNSDVVDAQSKMVIQNGPPLQLFKGTDSDVFPSISPANYDSKRLMNKERPTPINPFLAPDNAPSCDKNDTSGSLLDQGHPEESRPISIPSDPERKRSSRKTLTSEGSLEYSLPSSSNNSMVNIFEIELDEDLKPDRGNWMENLTPALAYQVTQIQNNKVDSSTHSFITEIQDGNIQTQDLQSPIATEIPSVFKRDIEMTSGTKDHYDATHEKALTDLPVERAVSEKASPKKIKATEEDVRGKEGNQETIFKESQEGSSVDDHSKKSEFEALDKEISNQLALIKEDFECYPGDVPVSNRFDDEHSGAANENRMIEGSDIIIYGREGDWPNLEHHDSTPTHH